MFAYMTEIDKVDIHATCDIKAEAEDMVGLLYHFLDELLFVFSAEPFMIGKKVKILEFDKEAFRIKAKVYGEVFDLGKHPQGTEVKAITYSNMQVWDNPNQHEFVGVISSMVTNKVRGQQLAEMTSRERLKWFAGWFQNEVEKIQTPL
ncbi:protein archease isoform X2 [Dermacentor variabilis]|uniref:protein archease isoform X2 n=1 Tax=Dermacentor variabilis TaxID=34621 RepID=UPI003F5B9EA8